MYPTAHSKLSNNDHAKNPFTLAPTLYHHLTRSFATPLHNYIYFCVHIYIKLIIFVTCNPTACNMWEAKFLKCLRDSVLNHLKMSSVVIDSIAVFKEYFVCTKFISPYSIYLPETRAHCRILINISINIKLMALWLWITVSSYAHEGIFELVFCIYRGQRSRIPFGYIQSHSDAAYKNKIKTHIERFNEISLWSLKRSYS